MPTIEADNGKHFETASSSTQYHKSKSTSPSSFCFYSNCIAPPSIKSHCTFVGTDAATLPLPLLPFHGPCRWIFHHKIRISTLITIYVLNNLSSFVLLGGSAGRQYWEKEEKYQIITQQTIQNWTADTKCAATTINNCAPFVFLSLPSLYLFINNLNQSNIIHRPLNFGGYQTTDHGWWWVGATYYNGKSPLTVQHTHARTGKIYYAKFVVAVFSSFVLHINTYITNKMCVQVRPIYRYVPRT